MHVDGDGLPHSIGHEGNDGVRNRGEHFLRLGRIGLAQLKDGLRRIEGNVAHRRHEQLLLGTGMPEQRGRSYSEVGGDVTECGSLETLAREDVASGSKNGIAGEEWRPAHL